MTGTAALKPSALHAAPSRLLSDSRLAQRATKGDRRAFEAIYQRYHQELYRFCLAMVSNPQDAQDALQNTMVKVLRALPGETREIKLKPWLYRIARNEAIETVRKRRDNAELEPEHLSSTTEIAQTAEARDRLRELISDLEELPERQRGALVMRELSGLGFEQIGDAFQTSAAVARQTVYEARLSLRQMEEGREMSCDAVMRELSDADGRVARRREIRAHLRDCANCRAFRDGMAERRNDFAAIAPLPIAVSLGLLHGIFTGQASAAIGGGASAAAGAAGAGGATAGAGAAGGVAGTVGAGAGKVIATSVIVKSAATVAVVAAVGVAAADRGGLIDVPLPAGLEASKDISQPGGPPRAGGNGPSTKGAAAGGDEEARNDGGKGERRARDTRARHEKSGNRGSARAHSRRHRGRPAHGRSHAKRQGRPDGLPSASQHGQQTATAHKSPRANTSPGSSSPSSGSKGKSAPSSSAPPPASSPPPKEEKVETAPAPSPPPEPPGHGKGGASSQSTVGGSGESPEP